MRYRSPFHLVPSENFDIDEFTKEDISQLKETKLAELNANDDQLIINDMAYSEAEVLEDIEKLLDDSTIDIHRLIWKEKTFLNYIERGTLGQFSDARILYGKDHPLKNDAFRNQFKTFVSPYIAEVLNEAVIAPLAKHNFELLARHSKQLNYVEKKHRAIALENIETELKFLNTHLLMINRGTLDFSLKDFKAFIKPSFYSFLNDLPSEMDHLKAYLAEQLIDVCIAIQEKYLKIVLKVYDGFSTLELYDFDRELHYMIRHNHEYYLNLSKASNQ